MNTPGEVLNTALSAVADRVDRLTERLDRQSDRMNRHNKRLGELEAGSDPEVNQRLAQLAGRVDRLDTEAANDTAHERIDKLKERVTEHDADVADLYKRVVSLEFAAAEAHKPAPGLVWYGVRRCGGGAWWNSAKSHWQPTPFLYGTREHAEGIARQAAEGRVVKITIEDV